ncbi:hypothetical protein KY366_07450 [Candidatus Woesearchaeota archaeon]|nr:hypothetical protein [Candidatus Woesearchaeota archaeon]
MVFARICGAVIIVLGAVIGVVHLGFLPETMHGVNVVAVGISLFIFHELFALFMNALGDGNKIVSTGVPLLFIIIAGSYFIMPYLPEMISSNILLVIAVLMCAEGLYRLH